MKSRRAAAPLEAAAREAWRLARAARHDPNYGRALVAMDRIKPFLTAPHPKIRNLARPFWNGTAGRRGSGDAA